MNIVFGPFAEIEYQEAYDYYEAEEPALGDKFRRAVLAAIAIVEKNPQIGREVRPGRRAHGSCGASQGCYDDGMATVIFGDFEWDPEKAERNRSQHGVSFEEAASVFLDLDCLLLADREHEDRFIALGFSGLARLLLVVHCERAERVWIISARLPTRRERECYERRKNEE